MTTHTQVDGDTLIVRRTFDAPQAEVFDAWIDAAKTTHWWGCANTFKVVSEIEPQSGGQYRHVMSIDGVGDHPIEGRIVEFDPPRALAYQMAGMSEDQPMLVRVAFEAAGSGTQVTLTQSPIPDPVKDVIAAGWTASFERLSRFFEGERRAA